MVTKLAAFRQQYPQYGQMSDAQLANALHAKFYSQIPFDQFASKVGLKTDPVTGAIDTFERSIPFADEASAGVSALAGRVFGGAPSLSSAWANARAQQKAQADAFQAAHPYLSGAATGAGIGGQIVAALGSGGTSAAPEAPGLLAGIARAGKGLLGLDAAPATAAAAPAGGLVNRAVQGAARAAPAATKGGLLAGTAAFANTDGDLQTRMQAAADAIPVGGVVGGGTGELIGAANTGAQQLAKRGMTATQKAAIRAVQILQKRAPQVAALQPGDIPEGQFAFQQGDGASLARAVAAVPGPGQNIAQQALGARSAQAGNRVKAAMQDSLDASRADYYQTKNMTEAARKAVADPLYAQSAATPVNEVDFQHLMGPILNTDIGQRAMTSAQRIAEAESVVSGQPSTWDQNIIQNGQVVSAQTPGAPMLDKMAQGWDEALRPYYQGGRLSTEGRAMLGLRNEFVNRLGQLVPANAEARAAWGQDSSVLNAMQTGRDIIRKTTDPELIAQDTANLTPEQQQAQNTGMAYEIGGSLQGRNPQAFLRSLNQDQNMQERFRAGFAPGDAGDQAFSDFMASVKAEAEQQATHNNILTGSRTTPLKEDIDAANMAGVDPDDPWLQAAQTVDKAKAALRTPVTSAAALGLKALSKVQSKPLNDPDVSQHLGEVLFGQKSPSDLLAEAAGGQPQAPIDANTTLKAISAANAVNAAGTDQTQAPPGQLWPTP
jgi:hypothetical protein